MALVALWVQKAMVEKHENNCNTLGLSGVFFGEHAGISPIGGFSEAATLSAAIIAGYEGAVRRGKGGIAPVGHLRDGARTHYAEAILT